MYKKIIILLLGIFQFCITCTIDNISTKYETGTICQVHPALNKAKSIKNEVVEIDIVKLYHICIV